MYSESARANCILRLKKRIIEQFPHLKLNQNWGYQLEYWRNSATTIERLQEAQATGEGVPLLLFIYPIKKGDQNEFTN